MACRPLVVEEILAQLDEAASSYCGIPMLDNGYIYLAETRLQVFRDAMRWGVVIEALGFHTRGDPAPGGFALVTHLCGNAVEDRPNGDMWYFYPVTDGPSGSLDDGETTIFINPTARDVRIRGRVVPISLEPAYYTARGITLEEPPRVTAFELLRGLLPEHRDALLGTDDEVRAHVPDDLPRFLVCDAWRHPDLARDERPSDTPSFVSLARALAAGDPALFEPGEPNTHWRHWPEGGTL